MCVSNLLNVVFVAIWIPSPLSRWARRNTNKYAKCLLICCEHDLFHSDIFITNWDHIWRMKRDATWKQDMKRSVNLAQSSFARHTSNIQIIPDSWFHITHDRRNAFCRPIVALVFDHLGVTQLFVAVTVRTKPPPGSSIKYCQDL